MTDTSTDLVAYDPALFPALVEQDPAAVADRFTRRFLQAETLEDLFGVLDGNTSKDLVGKVLEVQAVEWVPFESDHGVIPNAICTATDTETGEVIEFATTSMMLTMFIRRAELLGALPFTARITSKKTRNGQNALNFERA